MSKSKVTLYCDAAHSVHNSSWGAGVFALGGDTEDVYIGCKTAGGRGSDSRVAEIYAIYVAYRFATDEIKSYCKPVVIKSDSKLAIEFVEGTRTKNDLKDRSIMAVGVELSKAYKEGEFILTGVRAHTSRVNPNHIADALAKLALKERLPCTYI